MKPKPLFLIVWFQSCHPSDARVINLITASTSHPTCAAYTVHIYSAFDLTVDSWAADQKQTAQ